LQDAYALLNARLGLRLENGLDLSVWANNLTNKTVVNQSGVLSFFGTTSGYQNYLGAPRQIGATVRLGF